MVIKGNDSLGCICRDTSFEHPIVSSSRNKRRLLVSHAVLRERLHLRKMRVNNICRTRSGTKHDFETRTRRDDEGGSLVVES
jgi:hypothetical protein